MEIYRWGHIIWWYVIFDLLFYLILLETVNWLHHLVALRTENILFEFVMNIEILRTLIYQILGDGGKQNEIEIQLIHVDRFLSFHWKIPCFPVLTPEFV